MMTWIVADLLFLFRRRRILSPSQPSLITPFAGTVVAAMLVVDAVMDVSPAQTHASKHGAFE